MYLKDRKREAAVKKERKSGGLELAGGVAVLPHTARRRATVYGMARISPALDDCSGMLLQ